MGAKVIKVQAFWDAEARVWVATSDDLPGLVTEADTAEHLSEKLKVMIPELIEINSPLRKRGGVGGGVINYTQ